MIIITKGVCISLCYYPEPHFLLSLANKVNVTRHNYFVSEGTKRVLKYSFS